jgi:hypothetical protein
MEKQQISSAILEILTGKSSLKQAIYDNTLKAFENVKEVLIQLESEYNDQLGDTDERIRLQYQDNGLFGAQLKVAGDILVLSMHSNVFNFNREHNIWKGSYVSADHTRAYCGIINVYNFLADSFKYQRMNDLGYLICRIFINKENHFFVEGKKQQDYFYTTFGNAEITRESLKDILNRAINYALEFDLLVPPYDTVKLTSVENASQNIEYSRMRTGKRLGFRFNSDDIS